MAQPASKTLRWVLPALLIVGVATYIYIAAGIGDRETLSNNQNATTNTQNVNVINSNETGDSPVVISFDECVNAGYPVMESYPRQCSIPGRETFSEDIGNELEKQDEIRIDAPRPTQKVSSPLTISGEAVGTWFSEASFPVVINDADGNELGRAIAQAQGDWMTESFVPFTATLEFSKPSTETGVLLLKKDNPSGRSENDDVLRVPVDF